MADAVYTPHNCTNHAYQLDWSYSAFWHKPPDDFSWMDELIQLNEKNGIRILQHCFKDLNVSQFLVSTRPETAPLIIAQRLKGRLQHLIRQRMPEAFRRNYSLRSIGSTRRDKLQEYLAIQLDHHPMADPRVMKRLEQLQIHCPAIDLSQPRRTAHAQYWYNLHIVVVNDARHMEIREDVLQAMHDMIIKVAQAKEHLLSRAAILPDHLHLLLGSDLKESPEDVVLAYMNNLAYAIGMKPIFKFGYYCGTFSEYDLGVIPRVGR